MLTPAVGNASSPFPTLVPSPPILPGQYPPPPPELAHLPPSIIPIFFPSPPYGGGGPTGNYSTPRIFHGIGAGDPVFTSGGAPGHGKPCPDLNGRKIPSGMHYVPGPDECTLCVCEDGGPKWCKAVLCSPPTECKSFRVGSSCCDFICLDDSLNKGNNGGGQKTGGPFNGPLDLADVVPKIIIVAITTILSMSLLLFLIHRLRQKQIQGRLNSAVARRCGEHDCEDNRSMEFSMDFFDRGPPPPHYLSWWKPPSTSYFPPRGEAPPPYEEAIASTSNGLPPTFMGIYNNNNVLLPPPGGPAALLNVSQITRSASPPPEFSETMEEDCGGVRIATTSLTTTTRPVVSTGENNGATGSQHPLQPPSIRDPLSFDNNGTTRMIRSSAASSSDVSLSRASSAPRIQNPRTFQIGSTAPRVSRLVCRPSGSSSSGITRVSSSGGRVSTSRRSETEHLRRNGNTEGRGRGRGGRIGSFLTQLLPHPLIIGSSSNNSSSSTNTASSSTAPVASSSSSSAIGVNSALLPPPVSTYPPPYDYEEDATVQGNPYLLRGALTLPRHSRTAADYFGSGGGGGSSGAGRSQQSGSSGLGHQQRFSLQLNHLPCGRGEDTSGGWSSGSSSTLSLSTPNSPGDGIGLGGTSNGGINRPPSLSSSSSSNGSASNVALAL